MRTGRTQGTELTGKQLRATADAPYVRARLHLRARRGAPYVRAGLHLRAETLAQHCPSGATARGTVARSGAPSASDCHGRQSMEVGLTEGRNGTRRSERRTTFRTRHKQLTINTAKTLARLYVFYLPSRVCSKDSGDAMKWNPTVKDKSNLQADLHSEANLLKQVPFSCFPTDTRFNKSIVFENKRIFAAPI